MSFEFGFGFSHSPNIDQAVREAVIEAKRQLNQDRIDISIILSTIQYDPRVTLPIFRSLLGGSKIIGCSTTGIISENQAESRGLFVLCITSDNIRFGAGVEENIIEPKLLESGMRLAQNSLNNLGVGARNFFLFFLDGQIKNKSLFVEGLQQTFGTVFPLVGAGSCGHLDSKTSFQLFQDQILTSSAVGLAVGGQIQVGIGARHGWRPLGKPRFVTKSEGNVIRTIDNERASLLYEEYFNEPINVRSMGIEKLGSNYPLGIYMENSNEYLIRNALSILPDGSILCHGDVPQGGEIHVMLGNKGSCKEAAQEAINEALNALAGKKPKLIFVIESMSRLKLLGRAANEELALIAKVVDNTAPIVGFYANGEIYPFQANESMKQSYFQNESIIILAIA